MKTKEDGRRIDRHGLRPIIDETSLQKQIGERRLEYVVNMVIARGLFKTKKDFIAYLAKLDPNLRVTIADILGELPVPLREKRKTSENRLIDLLAFRFGSVSHGFGYDLLRGETRLSTIPYDLHTTEGFDYQLHEALYGLRHLLDKPEFRDGFIKADKSQRISLLENIVEGEEVMRYVRTLKDLFFHVAEKHVTKLQDIALQKGQPPVIKSYLELLTFMGWASLVERFRDQKPWILFHERNVLPSRTLAHQDQYRMSAGRLDALHVRAKRGEFTPLEVDYLQRMIKDQSQYKSVVELVKSLQAVLKTPFTIGVVDFKFLVGDGRGGIVNLDELFYLPIDEHIDQIQRYQLLLSLAMFYSKYVLGDQDNPYEVFDGKMRLRFDINLWEHSFPAELIYVTPFDRPIVRHFPISAHRLRGYLKRFYNILPSAVAHAKVRSVMSDTQKERKIGTDHKQTNLPLDDPWHPTFLEFINHAGIMVLDQRRRGRTPTGKQSMTLVYEQDKLSAQRGEIEVPEFFDQPPEVRHAGADVEVPQKFLQQLTDSCRKLQEYVNSNLLLRSPKEFLKNVGSLRRYVTPRLRNFENSFEKNNQSYKVEYEALKQTYVVLVAFLSQNKFFSEKYKLNQEKRMACTIVSDMSSDISRTIERLDIRFRIDPGGEKLRDEADRYFTLLMIENRFAEFKNYVTKDNRPLEHGEDLYAAAFKNLLETLLRFYTSDRVGSGLGLAGLSTRWYWDRFYNVFLEISQVFKSDQELIRAFNSFFNGRDEPIEELRRVQARIIADEQKIREIIKVPHG